MSFGDNVGLDHTLKEVTEDNEDAGKNLYRVNPVFFCSFQLSHSSPPQLLFVHSVIIILCYLCPSKIVDCIFACLFGKLRILGIFDHLCIYIINEIIGVAAYESNYSNGSPQYS